MKVWANQFRMASSSSFHPWLVIPLRNWSRYKYYYQRKYYKNNAEIATQFDSDSICKHQNAINTCHVFGRHLLQQIKRTKVIVQHEIIWCDSDLCLSSTRWRLKHCVAIHTIETSRQKETTIGINEKCTVNCQRPFGAVLSFVLKPILYCSNNKWFLMSFLKHWHFNLCKTRTNVQFF